MTGTSKWCPYCGEELPREAVRCSRCGHWLDTKAGSLERPAGLTSQSERSSSRQAPDAGGRIPPRRRSRRVWFALALIAMAIGVTAGLIRLQGAGETTAALPTLTPTPATRSTATPSAAPSPSPTSYPAALAQQTVQQYWDLISKGNVSQAYDLLSTPARESTSRQQFVQSITHLLDVTNGVTATAGAAVVQGATAQVPVTLRFTSSGPSSATQRLVWEGTWRIDQAGTGVGSNP
jgi:hypothetical protein